MPNMGMSTTILRQDRARPTGRGVGFIYDSQVDVAVRSTTSLANAHEIEYLGREANKENNASELEMQPALVIESF